MMIWSVINERAKELLGFIPMFVRDTDPRPAREQFDTSYKHGGGWDPFQGFTMDPDGTLHYPGDRALSPIASTSLRDEDIFVYEYGWVAIRQKDGSFQTCRMD